MTSRTMHFLILVIAVVISTMTCAAPISDTAAQEAASDSPSVPIHIPVNVCGNSISVVGILNPTFEIRCASTDLPRVTLNMPPTVAAKRPSQSQLMEITITKFPYKNSYSSKGDTDNTSFGGCFKSP
ncbi:hypothetical protein BGZ80_011093 [Entomortierella chlamydospora]|uniref:Chaplin domain-containing protein n=1 Tax=Entomortierella chlamydospora TaxID=101097 RepID=A0A9P6N325_9FUNG|nr:hypothetical protein BGZ80_011093 [Entomortierella chlamydospora]